MFRLLGISWDNLKDDFCSELFHHINKLTKTKRSVLKLTASLFDPLRLLIPFVIMLKVMFKIFV